MLYKNDTSSPFLKMIDRLFSENLDCVVATLKDEADMKHKYTKTQIQIRKYTNTKTQLQICIVWLPCEGWSSNELKLI